MTSQDAAWVRLPDGRAAASACRRCCPGHCGGCRRHLSALHEGWGATGQGLGVLEVGGAFVQYAQPLVSGSRPSWSRPTRADSGQLWAGPESNHDHRTPAQGAGRERWRRTCDGGAGHCRKPHGLSLLRGPVSTVLTLTGPTSMFPAGIVGILRFFSGVRLRCAFNVSTLDARTTSPTAPHRPRPHRLQGLSPPPGPRTLEEAARRRPPCAPRVRDGSGPDGAPASLGVPAGHRARR